MARTREYINDFLMCRNGHPLRYPAVRNYTPAEGDALFARRIREFSKDAVMSRESLWQAACECGLKGKFSPTIRGAMRAWNRVVRSALQASREVGHD